jgi:hypothetical protein
MAGNFSELAAATTSSSIRRSRDKRSYRGWT